MTPPRKRDLVTPLLVSLLASAVLGGVRMYADIVRLQSEVRALEQRVDWFHGRVGPREGDQR